MTSALMSARHAYNAQEEVLSRDPKRSAAGVVVGTVPLRGLRACVALAHVCLHRRFRWRQRGGHSAARDGRARPWHPCVEAEVRACPHLQPRRTTCGRVPAARRTRRRVSAKQAVRPGAGIGGHSRRQARGSRSHSERRASRHSTAIHGRDFRESGRFGCTSAAWHDSAGIGARKPRRTFEEALSNAPPIGSGAGRF